MKVRVISIILASLLSLQLLSCAEDTDKNTTINETTAATESLETEAPKTYLETLESANYNGADFNILCRDDKIYEVWSEKESGDIINDAVFRRNLVVEKKFNIKVNKRDYPGNWNDQEIFKNAIKNSVNGQDDSFQLVAGYLAYLTTLGIEGYFYDLNSITTIDFSNPWWADGFIENNTINNKLFFTLGDISLTMWEGIYAIFFNKQLAENHHVDNLYELVKNKEWTLAKLEEYSKGVSDDINGDSRYTNADLYGLVINRHSARSLLTSFDIPIATRNDAGTYDFVYYSDKIISLYENLYSFFFDAKDVYTSQPANDWDYTEMTKMFLEDRALFITGTLDNTTVLRQMDTDFGILPFPLYDENQPEYKSHSYDGSNIFTILASVKDPEMCGLVLEGLSAENKQTVIPVFYETTLKGKTTRDNESEEMLDILRDSIYYDFGFVHSESIRADGGIFVLFGDNLLKKTKNFASLWAQSEKAFNKSFEKLIEAYSKND